MRVAVVTAVSFVVACLGYNCSPKSPIINNAADDPGIVSTPSATQSPSDGLRMGKNLETRYEAMLVALKGESAKLGIGSLRDSPDVVGTEVRVLVGFGLAHPRCFILTTRNGKHEATLVAGKVIGGRAALNKEGNVLSTKVALHDPASGWDKLEEFLKDQGIESPIKLSLDGDQLSDPDEEQIVVEVKSGSVHSMVFFRLNTESEDGKKAWRIWERLKREFGVRMGWADLRGDANIRQN